MTEHTPSDPRIDTIASLLESHRKRLESVFRSVPVDRREVAPDEESWSVAEVVEHLAETERSITKLVSGFVAEAPERGEPAAAGAEAPDADGIEPETFDREAFAAKLDMPFVLDRSRKLVGRQPSGELDADAAWEALEESRRGLRAVMDEARGRRLEGFTYDHPMTGRPLDAYQWIAFTGLHESRHAEQIEEIEAALTAG